MSEPTRTNKADPIEDEKDEVLWGRVAYLVEIMCEVPIHVNLLEKPDILFHYWLLRVPQDHVLSDRLSKVMAQIVATLPINLSSEKSSGFALGYWKERAYQQHERADHN